MVAELAHAQHARHRAEAQARVCVSIASDLDRSVQVGCGSVALRRAIGCDAHGTTPYVRSALAVIA